MVGQTVRCPVCRSRFVVTSLRLSDSTTTLGDIQNEALQTQDAHSTQAVSVSETDVHSQLTIGRIGRFELKQQLGMGGFGVVYLAWDPELSREVALKVPRFSADDTLRTKRFAAEARAAANLRHPHIVAVFDAGRAGNQAFIAYEYIDGETLSSRLMRAKPDLATLITWVRQIADALAYAHGEGIVHRDIKPDNILLNARDQPQILDFGLAKRTNEDSVQTTEGSLLGTPAYMSPEQARGEIDHIGPASDQYSLGVVLYELLANRRPYSGLPHVVIAQVAGDETPPPPSSFTSGLPRDLVAICMKAISKDYNQRFADCAAFAEDLGRWQRGETIQARRTSPLERAVRWVRRNPASATAIGIIASALISVSVLAGAFALYQQREKADLIAAQQSVDESLRFANAQVDEMTKSESAARKALVNEQKERTRANAARADAENQRAQFELERDRSMRGLLAGLLLRIENAKRSGNLVLTVELLTQAMETARSLNDHRLLLGLTLDRQLTQSLFVRNPQVAASGGTPAAPAAPKQLSLFSRSANGGARVASTDIPLPFSGPWLPETRVSNWNGVAWLLLDARPLDETNLCLVFAVSNPSRVVWSRVHVVVVNTQNGDCTRNRDFSLAPTDCADTPPDVTISSSDVIAIQERDTPQVIRLFDLRKWDFTKTLNVGAGTLQQLCFSPNGQRLLVSRFAETLTKGLVIRLFRWADDTTSDRLSGNASSLTLVGHRQFALIEERGHTMLIDLENGQRLVDAELPHCDRYEVQPATRQLIGVNGTELFAAVGLRNEIQRFSVALPRAISQFAFSASGKGFEIVSDGLRFQIDSHGRRRLNVNVTPIKEPLPASVLSDEPPISGQFAGFLTSGSFATLESKSTLHKIPGSGALQGLALRKDRIVALGLHTIQETELSSRQLALPDFFSVVRLIRGVHNDAGVSQEPIDVSRLISPSDGFLMAPDGECATVLVSRDPPEIRLFSLSKQTWIGPVHPFHSGFIGAEPSDDPQVAETSIASWGRQARFSKNSQLMLYRPRATELELVACDTGARLGNRYPISAKQQLYDGGFSGDGRKIWALAGEREPTELWHWDTAGGPARQSRIVLPDSHFARWISSQTDRMITLTGSIPTVVELSTGNEVGRLDVPPDGLAGFSSDGRYILAREVDALRTAPWWDAKTATAAAQGAREGRDPSRTLPWPPTGHDSWSFANSELPTSILFRERDVAVGQPIVGSRPFVHLQTSSKGQIILTHDIAGEARLWHLDSGHPLGPPLADLIAWRSADNAANRRFLFLSDERLLVLESNEVVTTLRLPSAFSKPVIGQ
jgi:predicted Ser/Thr protein kinase